MVRLRNSMLCWGLVFSSTLNAQLEPPLAELNQGTPIINVNQPSGSPRLYMGSQKITLDSQEYGSIVNVFTAPTFPQNEVLDLVKIDPLNAALGGEFFSLNFQTFNSANALMFQTVSATGVNDLDGNGHKDLWILYQSRWFEVYLNKGDGTLPSRPDLSTRFGNLPPPATPMGAVRLDGTGSDFANHSVRGNPADSVYATLIGRGSPFNPWVDEQGLFRIFVSEDSSGNLELQSEPVGSAFLGWETHLSFEDINGDTRVDLIGANNSTLRVIFGARPGRFQQSYSDYEPISGNGPISTIVPVEFDSTHQGKEYFLSYLETGLIIYLKFNAGNIEIQEIDIQNSIRIPGARVLGANGIVSGDLNQDGIEDLVFAIRYIDPSLNQELSAYAVFVSNGRGDLFFSNLIPCNLEIRHMFSRTMNIDDFTNDGINDFLGQDLISGKVVPVVYKNLASTDFEIRTYGASGTTSFGGSPKLRAIGMPEIGNESNFRLVARSSRPNAPITILVSTDPLETFIPPDFHLYIVPLRAPNFLRFESATNEQGFTTVHVPLNTRSFDAIAHGQNRLYFQIFENDTPAGRMVSGNRLEIHFAR